MWCPQRDGPALPAWEQNLPLRCPLFASDTEWSPLCLTPPTAPHAAAPTHGQRVPITQPGEDLT